MQKRRKNQAPPQVARLSFVVADPSFKEKRKNENNKSDIYQSVQAAPAAQPPNTVVIVIKLVLQSLKPNPRLKATAAFDAGGNVVANAAVGFGDPLTVTVGAAPSTEGCVALACVPDGRMVKREDVLYMRPCVELMKRRK